MKRVVMLAILLALVSQDVLWAQCRSDTGPCSTGCPGGQETFEFTIPIGSLLEVLKIFKLPIPLPPVTLLIPDIRVELSTTFSGDAWVVCPDGCCSPARPLVMSADLFLIGSAMVESLPPSVASFSTFIPVVPQVVDNSSGDRDAALCGILKDWDYTERYTRVSLTWAAAGGLVELPLVDTRGKGKSECIVYCGCFGFNGPPRITSWPGEVVVPIGGSTEFAVEAWDIDGDPLRFSAASHFRGVKIEFVKVEDVGLGKKLATGRITVPQTAVPPATIENTAVRVCDPYGLCDSKPISIRYLPTNPPQAVSKTIEIKHHDLIRDRMVVVPFEATDVDLAQDPNNFGYDYWFVWNSPFFTPHNWDCRCPSQGLPFARACNWRAGKTPRLSVGCGPLNLEVIILQATRGVQWTGTYSVVEFNPNPPVQFGFASTATITLIVNNKPPVLTVSPSQVRVKPGDTANAVVTATDPDGDTVTLSKMSGPGSFPTVSGKGRVEGTYTWEATGYTPWRLVGFRATDPCGGTGRAYLRIRVLQPPRPYGAFGHPPPGRVEGRHDLCGRPR